MGQRSDDGVPPSETEGEGVSLPTPLWFLDQDAHGELLAVDPRRSRLLARAARSMASGEGPRGAVRPGGLARLAAMSQGVPVLRRWAATRVRDIAATDVLGEVAVPADAAAAMALAGPVARVGAPGRPGPAYALGALVDRVRAAGGVAVEPVTQETALAELRAALRSGLSVVVWAVGPPFVGAVTADAPVFPGGLELSAPPAAPVRPGPRRPAIDPTLCDGCGECIRACPTNRLVMTGGRVMVKPWCSGCGRCEPHCPRAAVRMVVPWRAGATRPTA